VQQGQRAAPYCHCRKTRQQKDKDNDAVDAVYADDDAVEQV
jgi:hypothetical protein